jgi:hypothetical protein
MFSTSSTTSTQSATTAAPLFDAALPRGLREEANAMSPDAFHATYAPTTGPLRLGSWECTDAGRLGQQARHYQATIAIGDRIGTSTAAASGPVAALTAMLYDRGIAVELLKFHQLRSGELIATFLRGTDGAHDEWAMGWSEDPTQSALRAMVACANRLLSAADADVSSR